MNQTFSSARFGRLLRKYWQDNRTELLTQAATLFVIMAASMLFLGYNGTPESADHSRGVALFLISLVACPLFTVQVASVYNKREQGISAFLLPASLFEKWLLLWLITGLGFVACFLGSFHLIDAVGTYYVNHREWPKETLLFFRKNAMPLTLDYFAYKNLHQYPIWAVWVLLHPFTLMATLLFRRYTLVTGVLVGFGLFLAALLINPILSKLLINQDIMVMNAFPYTGFTVSKEGIYGTERYLSLPQPLGDIIRWTTGITAVTLLYVIAYVRLKEREI